MRVAIVGSGHAAVAALAALRARGLKPDILDIGETLSPELRARVDRLAQTDPAEWPQHSDPFPTIKMSGKKVPAKMVFGSDYVFGRGRPSAPLQTEGTSAAPSWAKGGFSMAWGGAMLPPSARDLVDWPVSFAELRPHLAATDRLTPLSSTPGRLQREFEFGADEGPALPLDPLASSMLDALERGTKPEEEGRVAFGQARLAVDATRCRACGMCLVGCPYGAVATNDVEIDSAEAQGAAQYRPRTMVLRIREDERGAHVLSQRLPGNELIEERYDAVFLAAGPLGTARIVLQSLERWNEPLQMLDSMKFALPLLFLSRKGAEWPNKPTLADLFLEIVFKDISEHWLHLQLSTANEIVLDRVLARRGRRLTFLGKLLQPALRRSMVAWCGVHSSESAAAEVRLTPTPDRPSGLLQVKATGVERASAAAAKYSAALLRYGLRFRTLFAPMMRMISEPCSTGHSGGLFPMRERSHAPLDTDPLGRLAPWRRVFLADSSTFPSIPGTTIAPLIRANAHRIASEAPLSEAAA